MGKKLLLICAVAISTMCLSFSAFAPTAQSSISGHVYDQSSPTTGLDQILVEEIVNNVAVQSVRTEKDGTFSINVSNVRSTLRFSDPDYQEFSTQSRSFDLSREDCSNVSIYMTRN